MLAARSFVMLTLPPPSPEFAYLLNLAAEQPPMFWGLWFVLWMLFMYALENLL